MKNWTLLRSAAMGLAALSALALNAAPVKAQAYPNKTITIVVPLAAGTAMDALVRFYGESLQKSLGQPVIVNNMPGAAFMLAANFVARAEPDGYTLLVTSAPVMAVNPTLLKQPPHDPEKAFTPIAIYAKSPFLLLVNPETGMNSATEFVKKASESANAPLNYASPGAGTLQFLAMESLKQRFNFPMTHVPYRTSPQILTDLLGKHVTSSIYEAGAAVPLVRSGQLKALGVTSLIRHHALPDVPTLAEAAGIPGFEAVSWHVLLAPSGTPQAIVDRLNAEMRRITAEPGFQARVQELGLQPLLSTSIHEMRTYIAAERKRWGDVVRSLGLEGSQ